LVEPGSDGASNWMAPSFDSRTGACLRHCSPHLQHFLPSPPRQKRSWAGRDVKFGPILRSRPSISHWQSCLNHELGNGDKYLRILTTAGQLYVRADNDGNILALDPPPAKLSGHLKRRRKSMDASPLPTNSTAAKPSLSRPDISSPLACQHLHHLFFFCSPEQGKLARVLLVV